MANVIPNSVFKTRRTTTRNVLGIIPNNGKDTRKEAQSIAKDASARINYKLFAQVTAFEDGLKPSATQLDTREIQLVTVAVATGVDNTSVKLPQALPNLYMTIVNTTAEDVDVFSFGSDTLDGSAVTALTITTGASASFIATSGTSWVSIA
jgi:hypothetical protein